MPEGTPVSRHWILVLNDGRVVIDWGGQFQDILTGEMIECAGCDLAFTAQDADLDGLCKAGLVDEYNTATAYVVGLPERPPPGAEIP